LKDITHISLQIWCRSFYVATYIAYAMSDL